MIIILCNPGMPSKPRNDAFGDLLGSNFTPKSSNESKTLKDMKSEDGIENALDPDRAKVNCGEPAETTPPS